MLPAADADAPLTLELGTPARLRIRGCIEPRWTAQRGLSGVKRHGSGGQAAAQQGKMSLRRDFQPACCSLAVGCARAEMPSHQCSPSTSIQTRREDRNWRRLARVRL